MLLDKIPSAKPPSRAMQTQVLSALTPTGKLVNIRCLAVRGVTIWFDRPARAGRKVFRASPYIHHFSRTDFLALKSLSGFTRSEEHTSELQSLMRISYAVFC